MTGPIDFSGSGLPAMGAAAGAFSGLDRALQMLMQLKMTQRQMDFQREQATRTGLMQHGVFTDQKLGNPAAPEAQLPAPAQLQGTPQAAPPQTPDVSIGGQPPVNLGSLAQSPDDGPLHSPFSDAALHTQFLQGSPNLEQQISQAQGSFQLDPRRSGYGAAVPLSGGGFAMPTAAIASPEAAYGRALLETGARKDIAQIPYTQGPTPEQQKQNELKQSQLEMMQELAKLRMEMTAAISNRNYDLRGSQFSDRKYNKVTDDYKHEMESPNKAMAAYQRVLGELASNSAISSKTAVGALAQLSVPENAREASQIMSALSGNLFKAPFTTWENFEAMLTKFLTIHGNTLPDDVKDEIQRAADALMKYQVTARHMAQERALRHAERKKVEDFDITDLEGQTEHELWEGIGKQTQAPPAPPIDPNAPAAPGTIQPPAGVKPKGKYDDLLGGGQ